MSDRPYYIATLTFPESESHCTSISKFPWDEGYGVVPPQIFFIELGGKTDISLFADDIDKAKVAFDDLALKLRATSVENIRLKVFPKTDES